MKKIEANKSGLITTGISIGQIILDDSHYLTFWGYIQTPGGEWKRCDFVTNYEVLNNMLRYLEEHDEAVQMAIVQKLEHMEHIPEMIDFEAQLGHPVKFEDMRFYLAKPIYKRKDAWAAYAQDNCFYIQKVEAIPVPKPAKPAVNIEIDQCMQVLADHYELYLGYLELDFPEDDARRKANLTNDMKYTLAYYAWKEQELKDKQ
ncbi:hypothetical protein LX64_00233 [Chitinophaga skermanii]|uniref:Uncharacterized protein n=1 Tax=Chitinophaga skermanii TaxID=331697 RepID=A0A327R3J9_9BACT|nr:hypothetical protein [Chitinophaga skermanii]RAJ10628.1 hypothetical protein LX64_00233 [Chitinophaga skermanii]